MLPHLLIGIFYFAFCKTTNNIVIMKIDLHCHTKKTKQGDPETRNVSASTFSSVLSKNRVDIVAITNHNYFDKNEYDSFKDASQPFDIQVWPGVELDVSVDGESGHILIISNPADIINFDNIVNNLLIGFSPDDFVIDYKKLLKAIEPLDVILIAHYALLKEHGFSDKAIQAIKEIINNNDVPVLLEPSSLKSVGIMEANGLDSMIGSDVKDWSKYPFSKVPSLKMPIKDFRTFKLLLRKDRNVVDSFINQKGKETITISPFLDEGDATSLTIDVYNDVNVIFGGKATGKSKIISAIYDHYCSEGKNNLIAYYRANNTIEKYNEITKTTPSDDLFKESGFFDCKEEIACIKAFKPCDIVTSSKFYKGMKSVNAKGKISRFGFFKARFSYIEDSSLYQAALNDYSLAKDAYSKLAGISRTDYVDKRLLEETLNAILRIEKAILGTAKRRWIDNQTNRLVDWTISKMKDIGKIKSGETALPSNTGLCQFYSRLKELKNATKTVFAELSKKHASNYNLIGLLPDGKEIYLCLEKYIDPKEKGVEANKIKFLSRVVNITALRQFKTAIDSLNSSVFTSEVTSKVATVIEKSININSLKDCFYINSFIVKKNQNGYEPYNPSDGEKSMLQIYHVFSDDSKELYILDEPELSVGHNYINSIIVPKIRELSKLDKTIIISTHDANIAVRTLPLNTIYREYKKTYVGNLFIDELKNISDGSVYSWTEKSLDYLEGGENAFNERGDSYGI